MLKDKDTYIQLKEQLPDKKLSTIIIPHTLSKHIQFIMHFSEKEHQILRGKCKTRNRHLPQKHRYISVLGLQIMSSMPYKR